MEYCFYLDWSGWKPEVWAAWAQAILSAVAIVVAARMSINQEKRQKRAKIDAYVAIAADILDQAEDSLVDFESRSGGHSSLVQFQWWERISAILEAIPLHEIPDYRLYTLVWRGRNVAEASCELHKKTLKDNVITAERIEVMRVIRKNAAGVYDETVKVANELADPSVAQRIRYWFFKRRHKKAT